MSAISAEVPRATSSASKGAAPSLTWVTVADLGADGMRVEAVDPGAVDPTE